MTNETKIKSLPELVADLAQARLAIEIDREKIGGLEATLDATDEYVDWLRMKDRLKADRAVESNIKTQVGEMAVGMFSTTKDKVPHPAIKIKERTNKILNVLSEDKLKQWLMENAPDLLQFDVKAVTNAVENLRLEFVSVSTTKDPYATVAGDLNKYAVGETSPLSGEVE